MNTSIRKIIREFIQEMELEEDYPVSFNMETFKSLGSHAGRNRYAQEHLQRLAAGSSRIVYKIDDEKVLKLAKNDKGIAQNGTEISWGNDSYFGDILANIFDYDDKDLWVEMELARKVTKSEFKKLTGFDISDVSLYLANWAETSRGKRRIYGIDPELEKRMQEDQFLSSITEFSQAADIQIGDFGVVTSYGIVKRDGHDTLVITDYGLTKEVYSTHYDKSKKMRMWEEEASNSNYSLKDWPEGKYKGFIKGYDVYSDEVDSGFKATSGLKTTANVPCVIYVKNGHAIVKYDGGLLFSDEEIENKWNNDDL